MRIPNAYEQTRRANVVRQILVVANQALGGERLKEVVARIGQGPCTVTMVTPVVQDRPMSSCTRGLPLRDCRACVPPQPPNRPASRLSSDQLRPKNVASALNPALTDQLPPATWSDATAAHSLPDTVAPVKTSPVSCSASGITPQ